MSIRKQYFCCGSNVRAPITYLEKHCSDSISREDKGNLIFGHLNFDDGLATCDERSNDFISYSLNKRKRWEIMDTLPELIKNSTPDSGAPPVTCVIRKVHQAFGRNYNPPSEQAMGNFNNVVAVSSTAFLKPGNTTVRASVDRKNKTSTLRALTEDGFRPSDLTIKQSSTGKKNTSARKSMRGASRVAVETLPKKTLDIEKSVAESKGVGELTEGIVYEIGIRHDPSCHFYRKDRHNPARSDYRGTKSRLKSKVYGIRKLGSQRSSIDSPKISSDELGHFYHNPELTGDGDERDRTLGPVVWTFDQLIDFSARQLSNKKNRPTLRRKSSDSVEDEDLYDFCSDDSCWSFDGDFDDDFEQYSYSCE